jgi:hypothetical protein
MKLSFVGQLDLNHFKGCGRHGCRPKWQPGARSSRLCRVRGRVRPRWVLCTQLTKCRFFVWLVAHNKWWTTGRLARRGLDHLEKCLLYDQEEETIDHLLISCVFARQFWFCLLHHVHLQELTPHLDSLSFIDWWRERNEHTWDYIKRGSVRWSLWELGHFGSFEIVTCLMVMAPNLAAALAQAEEETKVWELVGLKGFPP